MFYEISQYCEIATAATSLAEAARPFAMRLKRSGWLLDGVRDVRYDADKDSLTLNLCDDLSSSAVDELRQHYAEVLGREPATATGLKQAALPFVRVAIADDAQLVRQKQATSPWLRTAAEVAHVVPGRGNWLPGGASPLTSMLASGLIGAAGGYGLGWLGEQLMPESWQRGRLRRVGAMIGGGLGMIPGAVIGATNLGRGLSFNDARVQNHPDDPLATARLKASAYAALVKDADDMTGFEQSRAFMTPSFDADYAAQQIWAQPLPVHTQSAMAGLVHGAKQYAQRATESHTSLVTPVDVARMAAGMGSGYLSGMVVGKALGTLFGAPPATQAALQRTGIMTGVLANLAPIAFRGLAN
jgi:hypothetical protein